MPQPRAGGAAGQPGTPMDTPAPTYGALLRRLSELERSGYGAEVGPLRDRLRAAVRERPLEGVRTEIAAVRRAAEALERRA